MTAPRVIAGGLFISFCYGRSAWQQAPGHWSRAVYFLVQAKKFKVEFLCLHIAQMFDASVIARFLAASALRAIIHSFILVLIRSIRYYKIFYIIFSHGYSQGYDKPNGL